MHLAAASRSAPCAVAVVLTAGRPVLLVVPDDERRDSPARVQPMVASDPEIHQQRSVAVERRRRAAREAPSPGRGRSTRRGPCCPTCRSSRPIAGGEEVIRRMAEARDDRRRRATAPTSTRVASRRFMAALSRACDGTVSRRGSRHAPSLPRAERRLRRRAGRTSAADVRPIDASRAERPARRGSGATARPIGTCASFHSPASPRMLITISAGILYGMSSDVSAFSELPRPLDCSITVGPRAAQIESRRRCRTPPPRASRASSRRPVSSREHREDVRQRIVGHVDDVAAARGVQARADAGGPLRSVDHPRSLSDVLSFSRMPVSTSSSRVIYDALKAAASA